MYKLIRFYNQNRKIIIRTILIIAFIICLIQLLNYFAKSNNKSKTNNTIKNENIVQNEVKEKLISNTSAISGEKISETKLIDDGTVIKNFMDYCNSKDIEKAYNLLSDECKEQMYSTEEEFYQKYYINIFDNKELTYSIENWTDNTYKVELLDDILSTGRITSDSKNLDYITIVEQDGESKLNINSFIGKEIINKESESDDIKTTLIEKNVYMDYEVYKIKIQNNTNNKICLDTKEFTDKIYIENNKGAKFYSAISEIEDDVLIINEGCTNEIEIKFNSSYSSSKKIINMIFENVVLNYKEYLKNANKEEYNDYYTLKIEL